MRSVAHSKASATRTILIARPTVWEGQAGEPRARYRRRVAGFDAADAAVPVHRSRARGGCVAHRGQLSLSRGCFLLCRALSRIADYARSDCAGGHGAVRTRTAWDLPAGAGGG